MSHLSRLPLRAKEALKPLCSQQEASTAAIWPENSFTFTFLPYFRRNGKRQCIAITHSPSHRDTETHRDVQSTASRCQWWDFEFTTMMHCDRSAHTTWFCSLRFCHILWIFKLFAHAHYVLLAMCLWTCWLSCVEFSVPLLRLFWYTNFRYITDSPCFKEINAFKR